VLQCALLSVQDTHGVGLVPAARRIVRNTAWLLDTYVHTFDAKWNKAAGEVACNHRSTTTD
jgi:hypothetical protein